ncbi:MAG TPA: hydrolase [Rhodospirillaceae bacterium]|nr:hydrolase [Rhodospirillaceae bacterium]
MSFDLIIWDCDGCLVDSEVLACGVVAQQLTEIGYPITLESYIARFAGHTMDFVLPVISEETGKDFVSLFSYKKKDAACFDAFAESLQPTRGVKEALSLLKQPMCVASGSGIERNVMALKKCEILSFFEERIFSSWQVKNPKPAPDVFLYAAEQMNVSPDQCLVIEDSVVGITAAKAAGMTVFGYMGGSHVSPAWRERAEKAGPHLLFDDMQELPELVTRFKLAL